MYRQGTFVSYKKDMTNTLLLNKIEELNELEEMIENIKGQAEAIKDDIKAEMTERNVDEMQVEDYIVKYIDVLTTRFDTKRFKEQLGEATYNAFTKQVSSKRFSIAH